jgi:hypothetical protein
LLNLQEFSREWRDYSEKHKRDHADKPGNQSAVKDIDFDPLKLVSI